MADIERTAEAVWRGNLRGGTGQMSTHSGVLSNVPYTFATRFEQAPGTNPDELLAAALASCYSMALAGQLSRQELKVEYVQATAVCHLTPQAQGGYKVSKMVLTVVAKVPDIDEAAFKKIADDVANGGCPISAALASVPIEVNPSLVKG